MLSAKGRDIEVTKGMAVGADAYVTKPFSTQGADREGRRDAGRMSAMSDRTRIALALVAAWGLVLAAIGATLLLVGADLDRRGARAARAGAARARGERGRRRRCCCSCRSCSSCRRCSAATSPRRAQLAEDARIMLAANPAHRATAARLGRDPAARRGAQRLRRRARSAAATTSTRRVREANARIEQERNRLAALMSELAQSVVVCNVEGRILLYNARARCSSCASRSTARPRRGEGARAWSGSGARSSRSSTATSSSTRSRASTTGCGRATRGAGRELRHDGARRAAGARADGAGARRGADAAATARAGGITGFVLVLDNITRRIESGNRRDLLLQTLTQGTRASLASMRAAVETIASFPEMDKDAQDRFIGIIGEEAQRLRAQARRDGRRVRRLAAHRMAARGHARRRPDRGGAAPDRERGSRCRPSSRPSTSRSGSRSTAIR